MAAPDARQRDEILEACIGTSFSDVRCPACGEQMANGEPPDMELDPAGFVQVDEPLTCCTCGYTAYVKMSFERVHAHVEVEG